LDVANCLLKELEHLEKQDALRAQDILKNSELNFKLEKFNLLKITFTDATIFNLQ
jgi:hypothetical protein